MINSSSKFWPLWKKNHFFGFWYFFNETNSFKRKFDQKLPLFTTIEKLRNWPWNFSAQKKNAFSQKYFQQRQRRQKEGFFFEILRPIFLKWWPKPEFICQTQIQSEWKQFPMMSDQKILLCMYLFIMIFIYVVRELGTAP